MSLILMASSTFLCRNGRCTNNLLWITSNIISRPARPNTHRGIFDGAKSSPLAQMKTAADGTNIFPFNRLACCIHTSSTLIPSKSNQRKENSPVVLQENDPAADNNDAEYDGVREADDVDDSGSAGCMPVATLSSLGAHNVNASSIRRQQQTLHAPAGAALTPTHANGNGNGNSVTYAISSRITVPHVADDGHYAPLGRSVLRDQNRYGSWEGYDPAIDVAASKQSVRLTPSTILYSGRSTNGVSHFIRSAQYLHRELPIRIAHRVVEFRTLPFIVGTNPNIRQVHDLYRKSFYILSEVPRVQTLEDEQNYSKLLLQIMENLRDVVSMLAQVIVVLVLLCSTFFGSNLKLLVVPVQGFKETSAYISPADRRRFLDNMLTSRLGMRILGEHHLALHQAERANFVGLICKFSLHTRTKTQKAITFFF